MSDKYVLYHDGCYDGFGAAWAAWQVLGDDAVYRPVQYGAPMPKIPRGATVYILDFSYPREELLALAERCAHLEVIDHHKTAKDQLDGLPFATFDMDKSGAVMAWERFNQTPVPRLLEYVQDRDLWHWKLPGSREVSAALRSYPMAFRLWNKLDTDELIEHGVAILRFVQVEVGRICNHAKLVAPGSAFLPRGDDGMGELRSVPLCNATNFQSEVGEELLRVYPDAPFAASFFVRPTGQRVYSLRCRDGFNVGDYARALGGGGHPQAAGFTIGDAGWKDA